MAKFNGTDVVMLGGPDHGKRYALNNMGSYLTVAEFPRMSIAFDPMERDPMAPTFNTRSMPIVDIKLGIRRARGVVYYPEISPEVAEAMLGDMVYAAWQKYEIKNDTKGRY